eukprot:g3580.t1
MYSPADTVRFIRPNFITLVCNSFSICSQESDVILELLVQLNHASLEFMILHITLRRGGIESFQIMARPVTDLLT